MLLHPFGSNDPLAAIDDLPQAQYLRCYLSDLGAKTVIEEPHYFDRDYLDEFAAYYSRVARPTTNHCRRLHFFDQQLTAQNLRAALDGSAVEQARIKDSYLGFTVLRPLDHAPLGRSVVKWYPDDLPRYKGNPRITSASRVPRSSRRADASSRWYRLAATGWCSRALRNDGVVVDAPFLSLRRSSCDSIDS